MNSKYIGIRDLKNRTTQVMREVREQMAEYVVTLQNQPVAILRPFTDQDAKHLARQEQLKAMAEMKALAEEVGRAWTSAKSGVELVAEQRR